MNNTHILTSYKHKVTPLNFL